MIYYDLTEFAYTRYLIYFQNYKRIETHMQIRRHQNILIYNTIDIKYRIGKFLQVSILLK